MTSDLLATFETSEPLMPITLGSNEIRVRNVRNPTLLNYRVLEVYKLPNLSLGFSVCSLRVTMLAIAYVVLVNRVTVVQMLVSFSYPKNC